MKLANPIRVLVAAALLLSPAASVSAQTKGSEDMGRAMELQVRAQSLEDWGRVVRLLETALQKGLNEDDSQMAKRLLASALYQRAQKLTEPILDGWPLESRSVSEAERLRRLALADLEKALAQCPDLPEAHLLIARLQTLPGGDRGKALAAASEAIRLCQNDKEKKSKALVLRAQLTDDPKKKLADYDQAVEADPANVAAWLARAAVHMGQGEREIAARLVAELVEKNADDVEALHGAAGAFVQLKKYEQALECLNKAIQIEPEVPDGYIARAGVHLLMNKDKEALADLDQALERQPGDLRTLLMRAQVFESMGDAKRALADVERLLELRPNLPQALLFRSIISAAQGKFSAAIADVQLMLRDDPNNVDARLQLAAYYSFGKRPKRAIDEYSKVLEQDPTNARALGGRGDALLTVGRQAEAIKDYEAGVKLQPEDSRILNNLAWVLATSPDQKLRNGVRSIKLAQKACEVTQYRAAHILSTLAAGYAETGDFDNALKWSAKAVELGDDSIKEELKKELESYKQKKPWRELQQLEDNPSP